MPKTISYNKLAKSYNELYKEEQIKKIKLILKHLNLSGKEKVLDVGCGTALASSYFKHYIGIDNSKGMLKQAKAKVVYGKAENLPFPDKSFDLVISLTAIHNFKDYKKAIKEMKRVSKRKIIISLLKKAKKFNEIKLALKDFKTIEEGKDIIFIKS